MKIPRMIRNYPRRIVRIEVALVRRKAAAIMRRAELNRVIVVLWKTDTCASPY